MDSVKKNLDCSSAAEFHRRPVASFSTKQAILTLERMHFFRGRRGKIVFYEWIANRVSDKGI